MSSANVKEATNKHNQSVRFKFNNVLIWTIFCSIFINDFLLVDHTFMDKNEFLRPFACGEYAPEAAPSPFVKRKLTFLFFCHCLVPFWKRMWCVGFLYGLNEPTDFGRNLEKKSWHTPSAIMAWDFIFYRVVLENVFHVNTLFIKN